MPSQNSDEPDGRSEEWWRREIARRAYMAGWKKSRGIESYSSIEERTMDSRFETWWRTQIEGNQ